MPLTGTEIDVTLVVAPPVVLPVTWNVTVVGGFRPFKLITTLVQLLGMVTAAEVAVEVFVAPQGAGVVP